MKGPSSSAPSPFPSEGSMGTCIPLYHMMKCSILSLLFFFFFPGMKALSPLCSLMQDWKSSNRCWHIFQWEWLAVKVKHLSVQSRMMVSTSVSLRCIWLWSNIAFPWLESLKPLARSAQEFHVKWFSPGRCVCPFSNSYCHLFIYLFSEKVVFSVWVEG